MQNNHQLTFAIVAGEHSGDLLGEGLIKSLKSRYPTAKFIGIGGPKMISQGLESLYDMEELAVMGLVEVLSRIRRLLKIKRELVEHFVSTKPDVYIGIDAPDFNLRVEKDLKAQGIKTVHYVSPSVWAWREKRVFKIAEATNLVLSLLPFEKSFYDKYDIPCAFVGHPLAEQIPEYSDKADAREKLGLVVDKPVLAILPGSRKSELAKLTRPFLEIANKLSKHYPDLQFVTPVNSDVRLAQFNEIKREVNDSLKIKVVKGDSQTVMAACDAMLMSSGTATLEAALVKRPAVVAYVLNKLTFAIVRRMYKPNWVSLPNILANEELMPEFLQEKVDSREGEGTMYAAIEERLFEPQEHIMSGFKEIHKKLKQNASESAATAIEELIRHGS